MLAVSQVGVSLAVGVSLGVAHSAVVARRAQRLLDARLDAAGIEAALAAGEVTAILDAAVGADSRVDCVLSLQGGTAVRCDCDVLRRAHAACKASPLATPPLVFVVDASGGVGVAVALAALRAAGLRADGGGRWLQALGAAARSGAVQPSAAVRAIDACLALEAHLAASAGAAAAVVLPTETYVFLAPHLFGWFPQARWVLAYSSASRAAGACACVGADADEERESLASEACAPLLSKLRPRAAARRVDSWLAVIGATLDLKDVSEAASFAALDPSLVRHFLPYMLKIDFILEPSTRAQALKQLVEYAVDGRSGGGGVTDAISTAARAAVDDVLARQSAATQSLRHVLVCRARNWPGPSIDLLEEVAFSHKKILLQNKVLLDTVLPEVENWKLTSRRKAGCGCCAPEEEDSQDDEAEAAPPAPGGGSSVPGAFAFAVKLAAKPAADPGPEWTSRATSRAP